MIQISSQYNMAGISVLTLVNGRHTALLNLIEGFKLSAILPDELIIVFMNDDLSVLPESPFRIIKAKLDSEYALPLAAARNYAASLATGDLLVFLDVDCIPAPDLLTVYLNADYQQCLITGKVRYLENFSGEALPLFNKLHSYSKADPIRSSLQTLSYELFWSLNFACSKQIYQIIGGFDELFVGYGGEDTDFAFSARDKGVSLQFVNATAYHQHHESYSPPLNHIDDIIANAQIFFLKWKFWPMQGWLDSFREANLISIKNGKIKKLRNPSLEELENAKKI